MSLELLGLRVAIDVQHIGRPWPHRGDRGTKFAIVASGTYIWESDCALLYARACAEWLKVRGADVLENDPAVRQSYYRRNLEASAAAASVYLACHLNAGHGSYALLEHMKGALGAAVLGDHIGPQLVRTFPAILSHQVRALESDQRGAVCIRACDPTVAALIVEPCFGDYGPHQALLIAPMLQKMGEAIGQGVAAWWEIGREARAGRT